MQGNNDKSKNNSSNEMKLFLEKIKTQLSKVSKREDSPKFPEEQKVIFDGENFKYEIEILANNDILL
jgi:hypothetical protein